MEIFQNSSRLRIRHHLSGGPPRGEGDKSFEVGALVGEKSEAISCGCMKFPGFIDVGIRKTPCSLGPTERPAPRLRFDNMEYSGRHPTELTAAQYRGCLVRDP